MAGQDDRTEQPTPRRLEQARKEGQFPVSREFVSATIFLTFLWFLQNNAGSLTALFTTIMRQMLAQSFATELTILEANRKLSWITAMLLTKAVAGGLLLVILALAAHLAITRFGFAWGKLRPDLSRLSPMNRIRQMPSENFASLGQSLVAILVLGWLLWAVFGGRAAAFPMLTRMPVRAAAGQAAGMISDLLWKFAYLFLLLGSIDLMRQRSKWSRQLRMTKQEIRDEQKTSEGNPMVKMRIRRIQRDLLRRRMMQQVPQATAVIVNPTHYAVAIRYQPGQTQAPKVVAKGKNWLALRIRETAIRNQVPIVENPPLAQALYGSVEVGQEIPAHLYQAVAEVLAYIFRLLKGRLPGSES